MANFNSTQHANFVADPRVAISTQELGGRVRVMRADFTTVDAAQNDTLTLGRLPPGAMVLLIGVKTTDMGTAITLDLGHAGNVDEYIDGLDVATAAVDTVVNPANYFKTTEETDVFATLLGGNPDSGTVNFTVLYVVD